LGGDADGILDFYCFHYYDNTGLSPFEHPYSYWQLDKPLVIAEFYPFCVHCGTGSSFENLYKNGYSGTLGWAWNESHAPDIRTEMQYLFDNYTSYVDINTNLKNAPSLKVISPLPNARFGIRDTVKFRVQVKDTDGGIKKVTYRCGDDTIYESTVAPYDFNWIKPLEAKYKVYISVTDSENYVKEADPYHITIGNPIIKIFEAENATLSGTASKKADVTASNGYYAEFAQTGYIEFTLPKAPVDSNYDIKIIYRVPYGSKNQYVMVNNDATTRMDVLFNGDANTWLTKTLNFRLKTQVNKLRIDASWGYMQFDYVELPFGEPAPPNGLKKKIVSGFKVYPTICNASDIITIDFGDQIIPKTEIQLTDLSGRKVRTVIMSGETEYRMNTIGLKPGIYILQVISGNSSEAIEILVQ
jgi:hypothetical protein